MLTFPTYLRITPCCVCLCSYSISLVIPRMFPYLQFHFVIFSILLSLNATLGNLIFLQGPCQSLSSGLPKCSLLTQTLILCSPSPMYFQSTLLLWWQLSQIALYFFVSLIYFVYMFYWNNLQISLYPMKIYLS